MCLTRISMNPGQCRLKPRTSSGCRIGQDYPAPIVEHAWARERTLAAYKVSRG